MTQNYVSVKNAKENTSLWILHIFPFRSHILC